VLSAGVGVSPTVDVLDDSVNSTGSRSRRVSLHQAVVVIFLADCLALVASGFAPMLAYRLQNGAFPITMPPEAVILALVFLLACQFLVGAYKRKRILAKGQSIRRTLLSLLLTFSLLFVLAAAVKVTSVYSRLWFFSWMTTSFFCIILFRILVIERLRLELAAGAYVYRAASIGLMASPLTQAEVSDRSQRKSRVFAALSYYAAHELVQLDRLVRDCYLDEVYISVPWQFAPDAFEVVSRLQHVPANVYFCVNTADHILPFLGANVANGKVQLKMLDRPIDGWASLSKRVLDLAVAFTALLLCWPLMVLVAVAIKFESRGPVLFRQPRQGFNGRIFEVFKFRSMRTESSDLFAELQTCKRDSRVTLVGRIIRRTSADELPQLFNVISGDMSIVGPRPHPLKMTAEGQTLNAAVHEYAQRHRVKPGLTGWAQINGLRGELDTIEKLRRRVQHDVDYIKNWSITFDLNIIMRTLLLVLRDRSAY
jgi:polysaccharide biosynthesis protein PslA